MKKLLALAAFLLASTAAQAQMTFQYGGYTIHVDPDRGTVKIPGVYDNSGQKGKRAKTEQDSRKAQDPQQAKVNPQPIDPPPAAPAAPATPANSAPAETAVTSPPLPPSATAPAQQNAAPAVSPPPLPPVPAPAVTTAPAAPLGAPAAAMSPAAAAPAPASAPEQRAAAPAVAAVPARDSNSPLGLWLTEEKEGKIRIEQCGTNLCGYSVDTKTNQNGEQVLINMKPGKDKWTGRILDPNTGSTYDSTVALSGPDRLRVQGCAFGGMFCGGQTWTRVN